MILTEDIREKLSETFSQIDIDRRVKIVFFKESLNCQTCQEVEMLLEELKDTLGFIDLEIYNRHIDSEKASLYKVERTPAIFLQRDNDDKRIVIYGFPSGYEFVTFIEIIKYLVGFSIDLEEDTLKELAQIDKNSTIKVFVTPTCPYCPSAAILAAKFALLSDKIKSEIIIVNEFPELAIKYSVRGVPKIVVNEEIHLEGARPESDFIEALKR